jgi:phage terminase large subunit-like protein
MKRQARLAPDTPIAAWLAALPPARRRTALAQLGPEHLDALDRAFEEWAHPGQLAPPTLPDGTAWSTWVIKAGRGFGKTRAGAEWLTARVAAHADRGRPVAIAPLRIALVGATLDDARRVMVEGESGLLAVAADWIAEWRPSLGRLRFRTGAEAQLFSGHTPHLLRGPQHHYAWCDELAKWECAQETWDTLQLGLRAGPNPQAVVTTTPQSGAVLQAIIDDPATVLTGGPTSANPHLPRAWKDHVYRLYAGTRLGRQELDGEILPAAGALWTVELIEKCRVSFETGFQPSASNPPQDERDLICSVRPEEGPKAQPEDLSRRTSSTPAGPEERGPERSRRAERLEGSRRLIAVDPPVIDGTCGIIACAREGHGPTAIAHILADHSVTARTPEGWASAVAAAAQAHATTRIVAEANQGGKMVKAVLHSADPRLRVKLVHAHTGKSARAEPVSHLFEAGRARLHGRMPELEAQMLGMIAGGGYKGPGQSPDRADAMVWGVSELMKESAEPRVRVV